jgi:carbon-monoxide dehydrogenase large subunit
MCGRIDADTGAVEILRYVVSEDCGVISIRNVVEGQIAGGVVQHRWRASNTPHDDQGNPLASTRRLSLPTATEVPRSVRTPRRSLRRTGRSQGPGRGGDGAPSCVINAMPMHLPLGVQVRNQPLGPADIVALIEGTGG